MSGFGPRLAFPRRKILRALALSCSLAAGSLVVEPNSASVARQSSGEPALSAEVPEPASLALFGVGLIAAAHRLRRRILRVDAGAGQLPSNVGPQPAAASIGSADKEFQSTPRVERTRAPM